MTQPLLAAFHPVGGVETPGINATVDGGIANGVCSAFVAQAVLDLLRRPVLLQKQTFDLFMKNRVVEFVRAVAGFTPLLVTRLRLACAVSVAVAVAFEFARDGGLAAHQRGGNSGDAPALSSLNHDVFPLG